jgi:hypothetical protein
MGLTAALILVRESPFLHQRGFRPVYLIVRLIGKAGLRAAILLAAAAKIRENRQVAAARKTFPGPLGGPLAPNFASDASNLNDCRQGSEFLDSYNERSCLMSATTD